MGERDERDFTNFTYTVADWKLCELPDRPPDFISFSKSAYWDYGDRVRRCSDHWGRVGQSRWYLDGLMIRGVQLCGECLYEDFKNVSVLEYTQLFMSDR